MPRSYSSSKPSTDAPVSPGSFLSDGRFREDGEVRDRGPVDRLVRAMVAQRRRGSLTPAMASEAVEAANATLAFPCWRQWQSCAEWALARAETSAEEVVLRCGRGTGCHWCGGDWASGPEADCSNPRHRPVSCPPASKAELERLFGKFGVRPPTTLTESQVPSPPPAAPLTLSLDPEVPPPAE